MRLGIRIFGCYLLIFIACFYYPVNWMVDSLRTRYLEGVEDPLVDQANIMATIAGLEMETGRFVTDHYHQAFKKVYARRLGTSIYELKKRQVDMRVYITDKSGKIIFDSENEAKIGEDYSNWRDVHLTLKGRYGARTTQKDPDEPTSSVLYVAAPIYVNDQLAGVLTVAKPTSNINTFLKRAKPQIVKIALLALLAAMFLGFIVAAWITRPIHLLTRYADEIRNGKRVKLPRLGQSEIGTMGKAFERMRKALEGKQYVEQYVQNLTHEIKSPLSAIRGAAELLLEDMPAEKRQQFLSNIQNETGRIQHMVDRMLELSTLENQTALQKMEQISFRSLVRTVMESKRPLISQKKLDVSLNIKEDFRVQGDSFLLHQTVSNLLQNAIDFSLSKGRIELAAHSVGNNLNFSIKDQGTGIPDYAKGKVFDKFFSLQRPDGGPKSTGLGLNFARAVIALHGGEITLKKNSPQGVTANISLPLLPST